MLRKNTSEPQCYSKWNQYSSIVTTTHLSQVYEDGSVTTECGKVYSRTSQTIGLSYIGSFVDKGLGTVLVTQHCLHTQVHSASNSWTKREGNLTKVKNTKTSLAIISYRSMKSWAAFAIDGINISTRLKKHAHCVTVTMFYCHHQRSSMHVTLISLFKACANAVVQCVKYVKRISENNRTWAIRQ